MEKLLIGAGIACVVSAIVGGNLKAFGVEFSVLQSRKRRAALAFFGLLLFLPIILRSNVVGQLLAKLSHTAQPTSGTGTATGPTGQKTASAGTPPPAPTNSPNSRGTPKPQPAGTAPKVQSRPSASKGVAQRPTESFPQDMCKEAAGGRFYPECFSASGKSTSADMAFRAALKYIADFKMNATLLLGHHVYPKCDQWNEPTNGFFVSIEGAGSKVSGVKQVCFLPVGSMVQAGSEPSIGDQPSQQGKPINWCRPGITIKGKDSNVISGLVANGSTVDIDVENKNYVSDVQVSCDPATSEFRGYIVDMAHNPKRIEEFISGVRADRIRKWQNLDKDKLNEKTKSMDDLIAQIRSNKSNPETVIPLLVQLNDL